MPSPKLSFYRLVLKPLFFLFDAESVHNFVMGTARRIMGIALGRKLVRLTYVRGTNRDVLPVTMAGIPLKNPIGLAAGFDKNAHIAPHLGNLGFGFAEIGTVTPRPQKGNERPRLFRIPEQQAVLNRMGFNNDGMEAIAGRLRPYSGQTPIPIGINIGKNKDTPNAEALKDYESLLRGFEGLGAYFTINISSPNTPGLRDLQSEEFLQSLAKMVRNLRLSQPVLVKLAPEVSFDLLKAAASLCGGPIGSNDKPFSGLVLTNTIGTDRGGISGAPLKKPSVQVLKQARSVLPDQSALISVGGIFTAEDVIERLRLGATAVQLYTGLVYEGPGLAARIMHDLKRFMKRRGVQTTGEFVNLPL